MNITDLIQLVEKSNQQFLQIIDEIKGLQPPVSRQIVELMRTVAELQDEVIDFRLKKILNEEHPYLPAIRINKIKQNTLYSHYSFEEVCQTILRQQAELFEMLLRLPAASWLRTGVHESEGHITFQELVNRMVDKNQQNLIQLRRLLEAQLRINAAAS